MAEEDIQEKVICLPETIFVMSITLIVEIIEFFSAGTLIGIFVAVPLSLLTGLVTYIWLYFKGNRFSLGGYAAKMGTATASKMARKELTKRLAIYGIGAGADTLLGGFLPLKLIALGVSIFMLNHPKIDKFAEKAMELYEEAEELAEEYI